MMKYWFTNLLGIFVFDNQFNLIEEINFKEIKEYQDKQLQETLKIRLKEKYPDLQEVPPRKKENLLAFFRDKKYFPLFYHLNLELTKQKIKTSFNEDFFIIQTISNLRELDKVTNLLVKRLREWSGVYLPELSEDIKDNQKFVELILKKNKEELLRKMNLTDKESLGGSFQKEDLQEIFFLGREILSLYRLRKKHEEYLKKIMKSYCPNLLELAGPTLGAELILLGKGLKRLALLPASTIQLLGAEKALFRHLQTGSKGPKYGILINHPLIQKSGKKTKGRMARKLADKLSLCARLDYFKSGFKAKQYYQELKEILKIKKKEQKKLNKQKIKEGKRDQKTG